MIELLLSQILFTLLLIIPGLLIHYFVNKKITLLDIPIYFVLSLALFSIPITLGFLLNIKLTYIAVYFFVVIAMLIGYFLKSFFVSKSIIKKIFTRESLYIIVFWSIAYGLVFLLIYKFLPIYIEGDMPFHLAHIRNITTSELLINEEAIQKIPGQPINPGYAYNLWYGVSGLISYLSTVDITNLFRLINPSLFILAFLSMGRLAKSLYNNKEFIGLTILSFIVITLLFRSIDGMIMTFPNRIGYLIFIPTSLALLFDYIKNNQNKKNIIMVSFVAATAGLVHNMSLVYILISISAFSLLETIRIRKFKPLKKAFYPIFSILLVSLPALLIKLEGVREFSENLSNRSSLPKGAIEFYNNLYYYGFSGIGLERATAILVLIFFVVWMFYKRKKWPIWLTFSLSTLFAILFMMHNPLVAPLLTKIISDSYTRRMWLMFPTVIIFAAFIKYFVVPKLKYYNSLAYITLLFLILFFSPISFGKRSYDYYIAAGKRYNTQIAPVAEYLNKNTEPGSVVMTDLGSGYHLAAHTNNYVTAVIRTHTSIHVNQEERELDNRNFMLGKASQEEMKEIIKKYNVDYIAVPRVYNHIATNGFVYDGTAIRDKLNESELYEYIGPYERYYLYKITSLR